MIQILRRHYLGRTFVSRPGRFYKIIDVKMVNDGTGDGCARTFLIRGERIKTAESAPIKHLFSELYQYWNIRTNDLQMYLS
jgi:hypothetical protein